MARMATGAMRRSGHAGFSILQKNGWKNSDVSLATQAGVEATSKGVSSGDLKSLTGGLKAVEYQSDANPLITWPTKMELNFSPCCAATCVEKKFDFGILLHHLVILFLLKVVSRPARRLFLWQKNAIFPRVNRYHFDGELAPTSDSRESNSPIFFSSRPDSPRPVDFGLRSTKFSYAILLRKINHIIKSTAFVPFRCSTWLIF